MNTTCGHEFAATLPVSPWVRRFAGLIATPGPVLDLATGYGRHAKYFKELGYHVVAIDRNKAALRRWVRASKPSPPISRTDRPGRLPTASFPASS